MSIIELKSIILCFECQTRFAGYIVTIVESRLFTSHLSIFVFLTVTFGCWEEGLIVMSPNLIQVEAGPPREQTYLVTAEDIASLHLCAQLVVLNLGFTPYRKDFSHCGYKLPSAFLSAGTKY